MAKTFNYPNTYGYLWIPTIFLLGLFVLGLSQTSQVLARQLSEPGSSQQKASGGQTVVGQTVVGQTVGDFVLADSQGKRFRLSDFSQEIVVVAFLGTECPLAKLYGPRLQQLADKYTGQVAFLGINSNQQDSLAEIAAYVRLHKIKFPVLKDLSNHIADRLQAKRTPEVFVLDRQRVVRYRGRIDDQYGVGYIRPEVTRADLAEALGELLSGQPVSQPTTEAVGCLIGRRRAIDPEAQVTYTQHIAPILNKHCVECHRPGQIGPFAMLDYEEVAGWAETIAEVVHDQRMPPWHAGPESQIEFANAREMTEQEKQLLYKWAEAGAPRGPDQPPRPTRFLNGWQLPRRPDLIVEMPTSYPVASQGVIPYQYFRVNPKFREDRWVAAAEVVPGVQQVVHHIIVFVKPPSAVARMDERRMQFLAAYVPGIQAQTFPPGMAKRIPAGSELIFQVHYTPNGSPQRDRSRVGIIFADPKKITHEVRTEKVVQNRLRIAPYKSDQQFEKSGRPFPHDRMLVALMPHMHTRGASFRYVLEKPSGERLTLLDVPQYDFNWQHSYQAAKPVPLPAGSQMHIVGVFDNSEENLNNPNPAKWVRWGDQTWDEMMIGYFEVGIKREDVLAEAESSQGGGLLRRLRERFGQRNASESPDDAGNKPANPAQPAFVQKILDQFDANGDGQIDRSEVESNAKAKQLFDPIDRNNDDLVTPKELIQAAKARVLKR